MNSRTTVLTPATSAALVSLSDARVLLGIEDTSEDERLGFYILQASAAIASYCNRSFGREKIKQTFRIDGYYSDARPLVLARRAVDPSGLSVLADGVELAAGDYELDVGAGLLYRLVSDKLAQWAPGKIEVTFWAGYSLPAGAPADLSAACMTLISNARSVASRDPLLKGETVEGVGRMDYAVATAANDGGLPEAVKDMLRPYRRVVVA